MHRSFFECLITMTQLPIHTQIKACPDPGRVLVLNDPATRKSWRRTSSSCGSGATPRRSWPGSTPTTWGARAGRPARRRSTTPTATTPASRTRRASTRSCRSVNAYRRRQCDNIKNNKKYEVNKDNKDNRKRQEHQDSTNQFNEIKVLRSRCCDQGAEVGAGAPLTDDEVTTQRLVTNKNR